MKTLGKLRTRSYRPRSYHAKSDGADGSDTSDASDAYDAEGFGRIRNLVRILKFTN